MFLQPEKIASLKEKPLLSFEFFNLSQISLDRYYFSNDFVPSGNTGKPVNEFAEDNLLLPKMTSTSGSITWASSFLWSSLCCVSVLWSCETGSGTVSCFGWSLPTNLGWSPDWLFKLLCSSVLGAECSSTRAASCLANFSSSKAFAAFSFWTFRIASCSS